MFLFELRVIAARDDSANTEFDPVFVFFGLLFGRVAYGFAIAGSAASPSGGKSSRKNQHKESARGGFHKIRDQYLSNGVTLEPCGSSWQPADQHVPCCRKLE